MSAPDPHAPGIESLSQRELRNDSGRVLRSVNQGESFVLTNSGVPVGKIVPLDTPVSGLRIARPAKRRGGWSALGIRRKSVPAGLPGILDDLRGDRL
ncbi:MAG: type II toxin-antitoxin system Phd/YefM family antitoxin [Mycobacteriaceae bacterium]|uniref:type II toxin-antitoxin system Phd/YefM family antitoxin n=1 Tax=Corynebacterium sp. TaxID=1720 RepID=UPI003F97C0C0